ncbi:MAG TPA: anti-sigma factor [Burkholderiaceae bacterium]|nr:anti-sigma factor [Burkholderiaceae bacterium]
MPTMETLNSSKLTEEEIHSLVDGQLSAEQEAQLHARLAKDTAAQILVEKWSLQRQSIQQLHTEILGEAIPNVLTQAAQQTNAAQHSVDQWWRWGGVAASVVLTFSIGWFSNTIWRNQGSNQSIVAKTQITQSFVKQASLAYGIYTPEMRHPVEVSAAEQAHLVQWLSKRLDKPLKVPNITALGFELVGGRLLPGEAGARAQFMYQDAKGLRITLYMGALEKPSNKLQQNETSFQFMPHANVPSFYWVDQGFGYALTGPVPEVTLLKLAQSVYQQL